MDQWVTKGIVRCRIRGLENLFACLGRKDRRPRRVRGLPKKALQVGDWRAAVSPWANLVEQGQNQENAFEYL